MIKHISTGVYIYFWIVVHSFYKGIMTNFAMSDRLSKDMMVLGCSME